MVGDSVCREICRNVGRVGGRQGGGGVGHTKDDFIRPLLRVVMVGCVHRQLGGEGY